MDRHGASDKGAYAEQSVHGLKLRAFEDGSLEVICEVGGQKFECMLDKRRTVDVISLPLATAWALREDIEHSSLDAALAKLPKRLKAYVARQQQVENTERKHSLHLLGRKLETAGSYTFIRADLVLNFGVYDGVLRLDMWYDDFSVHPERTVVKSRGPPDFMDLVSDKVQDIKDLLQRLPLDEACDVLCTTE
ncbi:hypothetical protein V5799_017549 [Amblyomma americanum]|uniref:Uncharacterized protein n=1 Tax=Amblyomma americanum TaxID=6943 RepID=A0AAQ4F280_AMBAM